MLRGSTGLKKQRLFIVLLLLVAALVLWNVRLFWIQVAASRHFSGRQVDLVENSVVQREQGIVLNSGRGDFLDRRGVPLTGFTLPVVTVFPAAGLAQDAGREAALRQAAAVLGAPADAWLHFVRSLKTPEIWRAEGKPVALTDGQAQAIKRLGLPEVRITPYRQRYASSPLASQVIGYIGQNPGRVASAWADRFAQGELKLTSRIGNAGLEKTFEPWLRGIGETRLSLFMDGQRRPLAGLGARVVTPGNDYYPLKVVTTIDSGLQRQVEAQMDRMRIGDGAVVVLDMEQADTLVMASRPDFQPEHVDLTQGGWSNKALKATTPGSIFKTITAAAALEEGVVRPDEHFFCGGELGMYGFRCWKKGGHGEITLEEAYAQSCNIVFAQVARRLGGAKLEQYAKRLGLALPVGWRGEAPGMEDFGQWDAEESGEVYHHGTNPADDGVLVQTAIGQRDARVTPLQAANLVVTLLHGGEALSPRIVREIRFQSDRLLQAFPPQALAQGERGASLDPRTARTLLGWMKDVVDSGTGAGLRGAAWPLAGKSGTAEVALADGRPGENQWFIGYGPADHPKYAVAVALLQVPAGQKNKSIPLFKEVMDLLAASENQ